MTPVVMCAYCGVRPVRPPKLKSPNGPGGRTRYCAVCKPIVKRETNIAAAQRWHNRKRLDYVTDPISGEAVKGQTAWLGNIGRDYLALKLAGQILEIRECVYQRGNSVPMEEE